MIRKILAALAALALLVGLAPAANAQTGSKRIGSFDFTATLDAGQSDLRPGGHVRFNLTARNHQSGFPYTPSVMNTYGFTLPAGFTGLSGGGDNMTNVGDHEQGAYWGGQPAVIDRSVARGSSRSGWLSIRIPANAVGGTEYQFGLRTNLETLQNWQQTVDNFIRFTLPSVATRTTVAASPATVEEGGQTTLTASVAADHGSNTVDAGSVEFFVDGTSIGSTPVDTNGRASTTHTVPLLDDREPVSQQVTAKYSGISPRFSGSTSGATTVRVDPEPKAEVASTVGLTATRGLVAGGKLPVTLDVTIDTGNGLDLPAGAEVEILRDGVVVDTVVVNGVTATYTDRLDAQVAEETLYRYTARLLEVESYDTIYRGAESEPVDVTLAAEKTPEISVAVVPTSVLVGRSADITASLTADGAPLPAGAEVIIRSNGRDIGIVSTGADGAARLAGHVFTTPGEKRIEAVFEGAVIDGMHYLPVTSAPDVLTVDALPEVDSTTVIELQTEAIAGDEVAITATVSRTDGRELTDAGASALGSVWFFRDGKAIGSAPVAIDPDTGEATAVLTHRFAERGEYRITADYSGISGVDEMIAPSETASATVITVTASRVIIDEPGPPEPDPIMIGSLELGSVTGLLGEEGLSSLAGMMGGN